MVKKNDKKKQADSASKSKGLEARMIELEKQVAEHLAGWQRARADYQNLKREWQERQVEFSKEAKERLLMDILPVYDHLKKALEVKSNEENVGNWRTGIQQIKTQWDSVLKKWKVESVVTVGERFNPERHEALQTDDKGEKDIITAEIQGGYLIDGQLLYPARVVVGTGKSKK